MAIVTYAFYGQIIMYKICITCKIKKSLSDFYFRTDSNTYRNECNLCRKVYRINYYKKEPWKKTFNYIQTRCNNPNFIAYDLYGGRGIKCLITEEELKELWFRDKAYKMNKPSIDRKDNDGNYTYDNCRFIEMSENVSLRNIANSKSILQFDLQGNFIREWKSAKEVKEKLKIDNGSIGLVCQGKRKSIGGFIWKYKKE